MIKRTQIESTIDHVARMRLVIGGRISLGSRKRSTES
jgi:hypothetical protein